MADVKISTTKKKKKKLADGLIDRNSYMLHEITSITVHKEQNDYW